MLARLDHPNCVAVYSYLESRLLGGHRHGVRRGRLIADTTGRGPLSVEQALSVLEGALSGLAAAHQQGIVHGDIKPENILLSTSGESKLVDFGLAAAVGTRRAAGTGSPTYSSPEAAAGEPLGVASDLYSVGLVLSELLAGVTPVGADPAAAAASVPAPAASLVARALDPDPSARQASARAFLDELRAAAEEGCGEDWRRRAVLVPIVVAAATGAVSCARSRQGRRSNARRTPPHPVARCTPRLQARALPAHTSVGGRRHGGGVVVAGVGIGVAAASGGGKTTASSDTDRRRQASNRAATELPCHDGGAVRKRHPPGRHLRLRRNRPEHTADPHDRRSRTCGLLVRQHPRYPPRRSTSDPDMRASPPPSCAPRAGQANFRDVWVFGGTPTNMTIEFGPVRSAPTLSAPTAWTSITRNPQTCDRSATESVIARDVRRC